MENFAELLMYAVPSAIVGAVAYLVISKFMDAESKKHLIEVKKANVKYATPIKLQAYERLILLLERIDPVKVVNRVIKPNMTVRQLHMEMIKNVKEEFEHNVTQQIYVSSQLWEEINKAKDEGMKLVTLVVGQCDQNTSALDFSRKLIQVQAEQDLYTNKHAIELLKREIRKMF